MKTQDYVAAAAKLEKYATCFQFVNKSGPFEVIPEMLQLPLPERYNLALSILEDKCTDPIIIMVILAGRTFMKTLVDRFPSNFHRMSLGPNVNITLEDETNYNCKKD